MTDIEIDEATGLPVLPERHFWRVNNLKHIPTNEGWGFYYTIQVILNPVNSYEPWGDWSDTPDMGPGQENDYEQEVRTIETHGGIFRNRLVGTKKQWRSRKIIKEFPLSTYYISDENWNPDKILDYATEAYKKYLAEKMTKSVIGDYPPKTLKGTNA